MKFSPVEKALVVVGARHLMALARLCGDARRKRRKVERESRRRRRPRGAWSEEERGRLSLMWELWSDLITMDEVSKDVGWCERSKG